MSMSPRLARIFYACALRLPVFSEVQVTNTPFYRRPGTPGRYFGHSRSLRSRIDRRGSSCECDVFLQLRPPVEHSHAEHEWCCHWKRHHRSTIHSRSPRKRPMLQRKPVIRPTQCHQALGLPQRRKIFTGSTCAMDQPYMYTGLLGRRAGGRNPRLPVLHDQRQYRSASAGKRCILERG